MTIKEKIRIGIEYIVSGYEFGKGWRDFLGNSSGYSTHWVSSYIFWKIGDILPIKVIEDFKSIILTLPKKNGGVGYSQEIIPDCDSTSNYMHACHALNIEPILFQNSMNFILGHQKNDGGFSTYCNDHGLKKWKETKYTSFKGWTASHNCVTAVVFDLILNNYPSLIYTKRFKDTYTNIVNKQSVHGFWESYWWHSLYFATSYNLLSLSKINRSKSYYKGIKWILNERKGCYWDNGYNKDVPCIFSTVLALEVLVEELPYRPDLLDLIYGSVMWLLEQQKQNGSWVSNPILRIPNPNDEILENYNWNFLGHGVGSCSNDVNNYYISATVIALLKKIKFNGLDIKQC